VPVSGTKHTSNAPGPAILDNGKGLKVLLVASNYVTSGGMETLLLFIDTIMPPHIPHLTPVHVYARDMTPQARTLLSVYPENKVWPSALQAKLTQYGSCDFLPFST